MACNMIVRDCAEIRLAVLENPMSDKLPFEPEDLDLPSISPFREMGAYEALWSKEGMSFGKIAQMRGGSSEPALSDFVDEPLSPANSPTECATSLSKSGAGKFGVCVFMICGIIRRNSIMSPIEVC